MGRQSVSRKAWQRAVNALLWYPDNKAEYESFPIDVSTADSLDPTADAALVLVESRRYQMLKQEIEAVETAVDSLLPDQKIIIRKRFWDIPKGPDVYRKPRQYDFLQDIGFSERTMRRVSRKTILYVAMYLGEK